MKWLVIAVILASILFISGGCVNQQVSDYDWRADGIELRQHETEGFYGCFGCSVAKEGPAMCIDPIFEMKSAVETEERHCNSDFEVVEKF